MNKKDFTKKKQLKALKKKNKTKRLTTNKVTEIKTNKEPKITKIQLDGRYLSNGVYGEIRENLLKVGIDDDSRNARETELLLEPWYIKGMEKRLKENNKRKVVEYLFPNLLLNRSVNLSAPLTIIANKFQDFKERLMDELINHIDLDSPPQKEYYLQAPEEEEYDKWVIEHGEGNLYSFFEYEGINVKLVTWLRKGMHNQTYICMSCED